MAVEVPYWERAIEFMAQNRTALRHYDTILKMTEEYSIINSLYHPQHLSWSQVQLILTLYFHWHCLFTSIFSSDLSCPQAQIILTSLDSMFPFNDQLSSAKTQELYLAS